LPGPSTVCLQILGKNSAKGEKNSAFFQKTVFTPMNDKITIKISCLEILSQKKF
jgi:hypothetical protein